MAAGEIPAERSVLRASERLRLRLQASCQLSQRALNLLLSVLASNIPLVQISAKDKREGGERAVDFSGGRNELGFPVVTRPSEREERCGGGCDVRCHLAESHCLFTQIRV